jgi:glucuronoarabinoxylan endo-1,4-beta-xylanase
LDNYKERIRQFGEKRAVVKSRLILFLLLLAPACYAQSATINWTSAHQVIDGFTATDYDLQGESQLTPSQIALFFGTGNADIGLSILKTGIANDDTSPGSCVSVSTSCAGSNPADSDIKGVVALGVGVRIFGMPFSVPGVYTTNGSPICTDGSNNGQLASAHYQDYANWVMNWIKSVQAYDGVTPWAIATSSEPEYCESFDSTVWNGSQLDSFIKGYIGPTLTSDGLSSVLLFMPDPGRFGDFATFANSCGADSSCYQYVAGFTWHDYDASINGSLPNINDTPYPTGYPSGKKFWPDEVSCSDGGNGPSFCAASFNSTITDALNWAALIDHRLAVDNATGWGYWWLIGPTNNEEGLMDDVSFTPAKRAYVIGQYSRFIRPGYYRIDATHAPRTGISVSAYQHAENGTLVIVATNYTGSPITQTFSLSNAPAFISVTPYITSSTQNIQAQAAQTLSGNVFSYTLPADSVTTFVGVSSTSTPAPPTNLQATVN